MFIQDKITILEDFSKILEPFWLILSSVLSQQAFFLFFLFKSKQGMLLKHGSFTVYNSL